MTQDPERIEQRLRWSFAAPVPEHLAAVMEERVGTLIGGASRRAATPPAPAPRARTLLRPALGLVAVATAFGLLVAIPRVGEGPGGATPLAVVAGSQPPTASPVATPVPSSAPVTSPSALIRSARTSLVARLADMAPRDLVAGPRGDAWFIDDTSGSVMRVDLARGDVDTIAHAGDGAGMGTPHLLAAAGNDLLILDDQGAMWRIGPGGGIVAIRHPRVPDLASVASTMTAEPLDTPPGSYQLYVAVPSEGQVWLYRPNATAAGFAEVSAYLASETVDVTGIRAIAPVLGSLLALTSDGVTRYEAGRRQDYALGHFPGETSVTRHDFDQLVAAGERLFVHDAADDRLAVFERATGESLEQWRSGDGALPMAGVTGMALAPGSADGTTPPAILWLTPSGLYRSVLADQPAPSSEPSVPPLPSMALPSPAPGAWTGTITVAARLDVDTTDMTRDRAVTRDTQQVTVVDTFAVSGADAGATSPLAGFATTAGTELLRHVVTTPMTGSGCTWTAETGTQTIGTWSGTQAATGTIDLKPDGTYVIEIRPEPARPDASPAPEPRLPTRTWQAMHDMVGGCPAQGDDLPGTAAPAITSPATRLGSRSATDRPMRIEGSLDPAHPDRLYGTSGWMLPDPQGTELTVTWELHHDGPIALPR
ncbi:MAG: hypothetical protein U0869_10625 [Chloroflexota bacterium]